MKRASVFVVVSAALCITLSGSARANIYQDTIMDDSPLAYYRFEDASAAHNATCADIAGRVWKNGKYINTSTTLGDMALVAGYGNLGQAAQFNGSSGGGKGNCVHIDDGWSTTYPNAIAFNVDGSARQTLSIEFWMKSSSPSDYPRIMQHNDGTDVNKGGFGVGSADGQLTMIGGLKESDNKTYTWYTGTGNVFDGQWHHVVVTYQPSGANIYEYVYIDGVGIWGNSVPNTELNVPVSRLTLGCEGSQWYVYNAFVGLMDEVAIYDTVLTSQQVAAHYAAATIPEPATLAFLGIGALALLRKK